MSGSHIAVALSDGARDGQVTIFAVHVVGATAGIVSAKKRNRNKFVSIAMIINPN